MMVHLKFCIVLVSAYAQILRLMLRLKMVGWLSNDQQFAGCLTQFGSLDV